MSERVECPEHGKYCGGGVCCCRDKHIHTALTTVEHVEVVRGWRGYSDGSMSPVERWVKHADGDWVSLDSSRRTSGDILMGFDAGVNAGPDVPTAMPGSEGADDAPDEAKGLTTPAPASNYPHDDDRCRQDSIDAEGFRWACREIARLQRARE